MLKRTNSIILSIVLLVVGVVLVVVFRGNIIDNLWGLLTEKNFIIPKKSNILQFKPTLLNDGSSNWWVYGEDKHYYYYFLGSDSVLYYFSEKMDSDGCVGFKALDYKSWCNLQVSR